MSDDRDYPEPLGESDAGSGVPSPRAWLGLAGRALAGMGLIAAAGIVVLAIFNFAIMPLLVRKGREVQTPPVAGMPIDDAASLLVSAGLAVRDTLVRTSVTVPAGHVIDQDPPAGRRVKPDRAVRLVVSRGGRERRVPRLSGQSLRFANILLGQEGYAAGDILRVPSDRAPENVVLASDPPDSTRLDAGAEITLLVSAGREYRREAWILPDLTGRRVSAVEDDLRNAGFDVVVDAEGPLRFGGLSRIVRTIPDPGSRVGRGDRIVLVSG